MSGDKARSALKKLFNESKPIQVVACKVDSVDSNNNTCNVTPADGSPQFHNVRLRSIIDNNQQGFIPIPKVGSWVLVGCISEIDAYRFVILYQEFDMWKIICDNIQLNGDQFGALIKIDELVKKINRLEDIVANHQHTYISSGSPAVTTQVPGPSTTSQVILMNTTVNDLANNNVKHG